MQPEIYRQLRHCLDADRLVAVTTVVAGPKSGQQLLIAPASSGAAAVRLGTLGSPELDGAVSERVDDSLRSFQSGRQSFTAPGTESGATAADSTAPAATVDVFIEVHPPRPKLIIVGAVHVASALITLAKTLGFKTIVVDPRTAFATPERFSHADELLTDWPDEALRAIGINENTYLALLSHDLKLDVPALQVALPGPARYIGALGSKKTHRKRLAALAEVGIDGEAVARIHNPIGLDLGGRKAEEIAVAILAEMIAVSHGKTLP